MRDVEHERRLHNRIRGKASFLAGLLRSLAFGRRLGSCLALGGTGRGRLALGNRRRRLHRVRQDTLHRYSYAALTGQGLCWACVKELCRYSPSALEDKVCWRESFKHSSLTGAARPTVATAGLREASGRQIRACQLPPSHEKSQLRESVMQRHLNDASHETRKARGATIESHQTRGLRHFGFSSVLLVPRTGHRPTFGCTPCLLCMHLSN
jgi:hypothetical protein